MPGRPVVPLDAEHAANFIEGQPDLDTEGFYVDEGASGDDEHDEFLTGSAGDRYSPTAADDMYVALRILFYVKRAGIAIRVVNILSLLGSILRIKKVPNQCNPPIPFAGCLWHMFFRCGTSACALPPSSLRI